MKKKNKKKLTGISFKLFKISDVKKTNYLNWLRDKDVVKFLYRKELLTAIKEKEIYKYVLSLIKSKNDFFYLIYLNNISIGTIKIGHIDWYTKTADIGIMIGDKNFWNKGIATKSIRIISNIAKKKLKLRKLVAGTPSINIGMVNAFKKNSFKIEGTRKKQLLIENKYCDHILFGKFI